MFKRYDYLGINYAKSAYLVTANTKVDLANKTIHLTLQNEFPNSDIRYVLGNKNLDESAIKYKDPIELKETTIIKASLFENNKPIGKVFTDTITFHKAVAHNVNYTIPYSSNYQGAGDFNLVNTTKRN